MLDTKLKIKKQLLPFAMLYGGIVWFRNKLFDWKILPSEKFPVPVICVGNITVGGTGKTPHVELLIRLLSEKYKVAVLSRGYKRETSGFILADKRSTGGSIGDEPLQIFKKFPATTVAVDGNRREGIKKLLKLPEKRRPDVILLDDAFQHRYVRPSLSILLTDSRRPVYEDTLLPAGRLRESCSGKGRADIVIVTKCSEELKPIDYKLISKHLNLFPYQDLFFTSFKYGNLIPCFVAGQSRLQSLSDVKRGEYSILLVAGIANPQELISKLKMYTSVLEIIIFPDHHIFSKNDIKKIDAKFEQLKGKNKIIITTEKDFIRLSDCKYLTYNIKKVAYYLPITVIFKEDDEYLFTKKIYDHVRKFKKNSGMA